ncbi:hypothetical protein HU200_023183 [Digitaria exilis]|uniref:FAD-binding domain-containing protein n=1 Tax=Digitaria exilis TaxID=1010633 RepID=A0A835C3E4_9POAL|nr:hypothetical protein HU200_023183 [Digitaria exilis]
MAARGLAHFPDGHGLEPMFLQFIGRGFRSGMRPCNETDVYWFFTWTPSDNDKGVIESGRKLKQFVLANLTALKVPPEALAVIEGSETSDVFAVPLRFRAPLSLITASISKGGVCVAGDALHPMTPDLGQDGCAALEDSVVLARCLGEAILNDDGQGGGARSRGRIEQGLQEYASGFRRWRSVELVATAFVVGFIQQSSNAIVGFVRDRFLSGFLARRLLKIADYDCGTLWSMEPKDAAAEDIVIAGAGLAGLATALGLHRKGVRSLVLESSPSLRASGFAFATWKNAFRALDALGVGDKIRSQHLQAQTLRVMSSATGEIVREADLTQQGKREPHEFCCVRRDLLLKVLEEELPKGTIRYSSKIVSIEEDGNIKILQLADGSVLRAKVLIGCDGINSVVAKWLDLAKPSHSGRSAARGLAHYPNGHGFEPNFLQFIGNGFRYGMVHCNETDIYWFFTWTPSENDKGVDESAAKMKQFVLDKLRGSRNVPEDALAVIDKSEMGDVLAAPLRFRPPLSLIAASISKGNVCVAGDALHPMTPDLGQGGCAALEDGVVLARCLGEALAGEEDAVENERIEAALREYARIRRWRSVELIATAYTVGFIQQSNNVIVSFLRDKFLSGVLAGKLLKMAEHDCGTLSD